MLSKSRYITQADLEGARHAQQTPPPTTRKRKSKNSTKKAPSKRRHPGQRGTDQGDVILADDSKVERQVDEIERLGGLEESTNKEEELQNEGKTGYERLLLVETSANIRRTAWGLSSVSAALGGQRVGGRGKGKGVIADAS